MMSISANLWKNLVLEFKKDLSPQVFDTWFKPIKLISSTEDSITIEFPNQLYQDWFRKHYMEKINSFLASSYKRPIRVNTILATVDITSTALSSALREKPAPTSQHPLGKNNILNTNYSFDNFVVGTGNRFAHAASVAVAQAPAKAYNPLFIYGGVGLGKTHLMHAIGLHILKDNPSTKVFYVSSESFTNELINAIQNRTTLKFRSKFRGVDVLLIDDVHFLGGKEHSQEEFFHTFNTLYNSHKQIILSSDRPPKEIANLGERLISRFEWGLLTDLQPPDIETRIAILKKKAELNSLMVPDDVLLYIAERIKTNIRRLEGALIRVVSKASLTGRELTVNLAGEVLQDIIIDKQETIITIDTIQKKVAEYFDIRVADMKTKRRPKSIAFPRQIAMFLSRKLTNHSLPEIGEAYGGRDHTTVLHAYRTIEEQMHSDFNIQKTVSIIKQRLKP